MDSERERERKSKRERERETEREGGIGREYVAQRNTIMVFIILEASRA